MLFSDWVIVTPWAAACHIALSFIVSWSLLKYMSIESMMPSNHIILCYPHESFPASASFPVIRLFKSGEQNFETSASASVLPMNIQGWFPLELTCLISLQSKSLLQHHSSKAPILWCSAFFKVQLYPYMTTGKNITLTIHTFVGKVVSLLFNVLSRFVIPFLPRSKLLLISWLQSLFTVAWSPVK